MQLQKFMCGFVARKLPSCHKEVLTSREKNFLQFRGRYSAKGCIQGLDILWFARLEDVDLDLHVN